MYIPKHTFSFSTYMGWTPQIFTTIFSLVLTLSVHMCWNKGQQKGIFVCMYVHTEMHYNPPKPLETLKSHLNPLKPPYLSPVSSVIFSLLLGNITQIININLICQKVVSRGKISIFWRHFIYSNFKSLTKYSALKILKFCL